MKTNKEKLENVLYAIAINDDSSPDEIKKELENQGIDIDKKN